MNNPLKKRNPRFIRQNAPSIKSLDVKWRRAKGIQSKVRMSIKGHRDRVKIGYGNKKEIKNKFNGLDIIRVSNMKELESINPKTHIAIIASNTGLKKKEQMLIKSKELKIKILNIRKVEEYLKKIDEARKQKQSKKKQLVSKKQDTEKPKESIKEDKKDEEAKKKEQEEHKRKILEKGLSK